MTDVLVPIVMLSLLAGGLLYLNNWLRERDRRRQREHLEAMRRTELRHLRLRLEEDEEHSRRLIRMWLDETKDRDTTDEGDPYARGVRALQTKPMDHAETLMAIQKLCDATGYPIPPGEPDAGEAPMICETPDGYRVRVEVLPGPDGKLPNLRVAALKRWIAEHPLVPEAVQAEEDDTVARLLPTHTRRAEG